MFLQASLLTKTLVTLVTRERSFSRVSAHVNIEVSDFAATFTTFAWAAGIARATVPLLMRAAVLL